MRIYKNAIILFRLNLNTDIVKVKIIYFHSLFNFKVLRLDVSLQSATMSDVLETCEKTINKLRQKYKLRDLSMYERLSDARICSNIRDHKS